MMVMLILLSDSRTIVIVLGLKISWYISTTFFARCPLVLSGWAIKLRMLILHTGCLKARLHMRFLLHFCMQLLSRPNFAMKIASVI